MMNILLPIRQPFTSQIFSGIKPVEFRNRIPRNLHPGDKVYIYESKYKGGSGKVLGYATVKTIHEIDQKIKYGSYILSEFYLSLFGTDEEKAAFEKVKSLQIEGIKKGFAIQYIMEPQRLEFLSIYRRQFSDREAFNYCSLKENLDNMDNSKEYCNKVDTWGEEIGFYDESGRSQWKYAIELENPVKFNIRKDLTKFRKLDKTVITKAPQSFCYIKDICS